MSNSFDPRSAIRERLYLLSVYGPAELYGQYSYNPHTDTWTHVSGRRIPVKTEGSESLDKIARVWGFDRARAMLYIGYPEKD